MAIRAGNGVVYGIPGKGDQVLQVKDGHGFVTAQVGATVVSQEPVDLPLALELGSE